MLMKPHQPVQCETVVDNMVATGGSTHLDCTIGGGSFFKSLWKRTGLHYNFYGIDQDTEALERATRNLAECDCRLNLKHGNFADLEEFVAEWGVSSVDSIIYDLGLSSEQIDNPARGFSFMNDGPLKMTFHEDEEENAEKFVNTASEKELADTIWKHSGEKRSRRIAAEIIRQRPLHRTVELANLVRRVCRGKYEIKSISRVFMAIRVHLNCELLAIEKSLPVAIDLLSKGGRIIVLSYDSEEDSRVKSFFKRESASCICPPESPVCNCNYKPRLVVLTKKAIKPSPDELATNPRSSASRLRIAQRI